jgi:hypothetical protein
MYGNNIVILTVSNVGAWQGAWHRRKRIGVINIVVAFVTVAMVVIFVFIFVADFRMKLFVRLEIFGKQEFRIFGHEILGQSGQTVKTKQKTNQH